MSKGVTLLGGVALLEWVWPCWRNCVNVGMQFEVSYAQDMSQSACCLQDGEFPVTPVPHLPAYHHVPIQDENKLKL